MAHFAAAFQQLQRRGAAAGGGQAARGDRRQGAARGDHRRPAAERAALRHAAQHHEGEEEAARGAQTRRPGGGHDAADQDPEGRRAAQARRGREGARRRDAGRQAQERSQGDLKMSALVIAEHDHGSLKGATLNTVTAALACGGEVHVLVAGHNAAGAAQAAAQIAGVAKVLLADAPQLAEQLAENVAAQVLAVSGNYSHILFPATAHGKNVAPRVAAKLDVAQVSDITRVVGADTFERPIYAGNAIATVQVGDPVKVLTVRTTGFDPAPASGGSAAVQTVAAVGDSGAIQHPAGMKDSKAIVALNKDPEAPNLAIADYGLEADLFVVIPELVQDV